MSKEKKEGEERKVAWIDELRLKVASLRSGLSFVCSADRIRHIELTVYLRKILKFETVYSYDGWAGLSKFDPAGKKWTALETNPAKNITKELYALVTEPNHDTAVIIRNYNEATFLPFLNYVVTDFKITKNKNAIICVADDTSKIPQSLIEKVNLVDIVTSHDERKMLIEAQLREEKIDADYDHVARVLSGCNLDQTEACISSSVKEFRAINYEHLQKTKREFIARRGDLTLLESERGFECVGGYNYLKDFLKRYVIVPIKNPALAQKFGVAMPKGILLWGIEGTGKTILAKALGKELNMPVCQVHSSMYRSKFFGETESRVKNAIKAILELSPCIVFIDEIEHLGYRPTGETDSGTSQNVFTMLLSYMSESHGSLVLGTTNKIERLDEAFMRAGRIDFYLPQMLPDSEARKAIWNVHTKVVRNVPISSDVDVDKVVEMMKYANGAEIELLVRTASTLALNDAISSKKAEVTMEHLNQAFNERRIDKEDRKTRSKLYKKWAAKNCSQTIIEQAFRETEDGDVVEMSETLKSFTGEKGGI